MNQRFFNFFLQEHGKSLLEGEAQDIFVEAMIAMKMDGNFLEFDALAEDMIEDIVMEAENEKTGD